MLIAVGAAAWLLKDLDFEAAESGGLELEETSEAGDSDRKVAETVEA